MSKSRFLRTSIALASATALAGALGGCASTTAPAAEPEEVSFEGETISLIVPFAPGGSSDVIARLVAAELPAFLEGEPTIIVENVEGGGGASGMQRMLSKKADGTTIAVGTAGNLTRWLLGEPGHDYPLPDMPAIGALYSGTTATVGLADAVQDLDDVVEDGTEVKIGSTSAGSSLALQDKIASDLLGLNAQQVFGYGGVGDLATALERNEIQLATAPEVAYRSTFKALLDADTIAPLWQNGTFVDGEIERAESQPDIPTLPEEYERITGETFEGAEADAWTTLAAMTTVGTTMFTSPGTDEAVVDALRTALAEMAASDSWKEQNEKSFGYVITVPSTEATLAALDEVYTADEDVVATLKDLVAASNG